MAPIICLLLLLSIPPAEPTLSIEPAEPLLDEPFHLQATGLQPNQTATLQAETMIRGQTWRAEATFQANPQGVIDIARHVPLFGSYTGADPMGLVWAMQTSDPPAPREKIIPLKITDPRLLKISLMVNGKTIATREIKRWLARPGVRVRDVHDKGLVGKLFLPEKTGRYPGVLVLSGSEGGMSEPHAALLASRGYAAFALAYFNASKLPSQLSKIPLEYLQTGIHWFKSHPEIDPNRLGILGGSKGGELSLLLASRFPEFKAVVAYVPSHVVWTGIGGNYQDSSWTWEGKPLPCAVPKFTPAAFAMFAGNKPVRLTEIYQSGLADAERVQAALIPVEKINGAILLISGGQDQMWPSAIMSDLIIARLKEHHFPRPYQHLRYDDAGHGIPSVYAPTQTYLTSGRFALGGSAPASAAALMDSRPKVLQFLQAHLQPIK